MSTITLAAVPSVTPKPLPWHRLGWVVWRRHRGTLTATLAVLAGVTVYLVVTGFRSRSAWHTVQACTPAHSQVCAFAWNNFSNANSNPAILSALFLFAPLLIGAFTGAPLLGRELESGTFRYTWTQGVGRTRWAYAMITSGAVVVASLAGGLGALISWHDQPLWSADVAPRLAAIPWTGVAVIGWALLAYAVGLLAGLLLRRALPALGTAVIATFGVAFAASRVRWQYLTPVKTSSLDYVAGSQTVSQWWEKAGAHVGTADLDSVLRAAGLQQIDTGSQSVSPGAISDDPITYLLHHGYTQWTSYQPGSRYWAMQWIEFGWLAVLAGTIIAATLLLLKHRDA
ncbi:hypothetical protein ACPPVS_01365 [Cellulomonas sp. McL0617]|uniref:hypothetical protein n=1 Tax=Cellulomonas sp. McL0617 TaxID=3415675 RepID=UPI003CF72A4C